MNKILPRAFENFFINKTSPYLYNTRGNPKMFHQEKQLMAQTHPHYMQFVHEISSKTKSTSLHHSLTLLPLNS